MNPRRRRHNRLARKQRKFDAWWREFSRRGTFSNLVPTEPITIESMQAVIDRLRETRELFYRPILRPRLYEPLPPFGLLKGV